MARFLVRLGTVALAALTVLVWSEPSQAAGVPPVEKKFTLPDGLAELSGLAMSARHPGVVYAHNDSGNPAEVFALDTATGAVRARLSVAGARNVDWEAIAVGADDAGRPALFLGDIGDNSGDRQQVTVYRVPEPEHLATGTVAATAFPVKFADGPRDAESMFIDPKSNRLYVTSKVIFLPGRLYQAPLPLRAGQVNTLTPIGPAPSWATDAAYSPDGRAYVIRSGKPLGSDAAYVYDAGGDRIATVSLPAQEQGESVTYFDRTSLLVGSENDRQVWLVHLPPEAIPAS
ncbi:hypothetical protein [Amycolatopsis anabasis]|uniref:hypothetical protein n=1 Tax=Amycolatopsis anabasis TaxID=1840409 RepID=UPI00131AB54B|nr:hypothetical protein [Amycolatopsis anabasis]